MWGSRKWVLESYDHEGGINTLSMDKFPLWSHFSYNS